LIVKGNVSFEYSNSLIALKKLERVIENLDMYGCHNLIDLGNLKYIEGYLYCEHCYSLPSLFKLEETGGVGAYDCKNLKNLGSLKTIKNSANFNDCKNLISLGNLKYVERNLFLKNCKKLKELPKHIKIDGFVEIEGSGITKDYMKKHHPNIVFY
jgi:hypothetical protein